MGRDAGRSERCTCSRVQPPTSAPRGLRLPAGGLAAALFGSLNLVESAFYGAGRKYAIVFIGGQVFAMAAN
jgi:hypothetical protein